MQMISIGDNLHEMSTPDFWENITNLSSAELAQGVVKDEQNLCTVERQ